ncbi:MAG: DUF2085 domain-containing protein [Actinobacteria bacterium]|nr:DUF2085 domain-containing protein [Actinomycetota bacterium]
MLNFIIMFNSIINKIGASVCHQLPQRTLLIGRLLMPLCARCDGIYFGFLVSAIILFIMFRKRESGIPPLYVIIILALFIISTIIDGLISNFFPAHTNNYLRFITGFLSGSSVMVFLYPVFVSQYFRESVNIKIFSKPLKFIIFIFINLVFIVIALADVNFLNYFFYYLSSAAVIFTFYFINFVVILLIPVFSQKAERLFTKFLVLPSIISIILTVCELFIFYKFHLFVKHLFNS